MSSSHRMAKRGSRATAAVFAERVRHYRKAAGLSQEVLSRICGLGDSYTGRLERGNGNPRLRTIERFARALQVTVPELLTPDATRKSGRRGR